MNKTREEFLKKIENQILGLNFDKRFLENPQFADIISDFCMSIGFGLPSETNLNYVSVTPFKDTYLGEGIRISPFTNDQKNKECWEISCPNETEIRYGMLRKITSLKDQDSKEEYVILRDTEKIAKLSKEGELIIDKYHAEATNINCTKEEMSVYGFHVRDTYDNSGVMVMQKSESLAPFIRKGDINQPQNILDYIKHSSEYNQDITLRPSRTTSLLRYGLDIAGKHETIREGKGYYKTVFSGIVPLNTESGVREMRIYGENFPEVKILPMPQEKIDELIEMEKNPKVKDRLREIARGRENFYYNSENDENFIYVSESTNSKGR